MIAYINHYSSKTVEDQAVLPHHDRGHQSPHTQHIVGLGGILIVFVTLLSVFVARVCWY